MSDRQPAPHRMFATRLLSIALIPVICLTLAACGGSKPAYCTDRANLEKSVKGLADLSVSSGVSGLEAQLTKIKTNTTALVKSAHSDFPDETAAIKSSLNTLSETVSGLSSSPSASDVATVAAQTSAFITSVKKFMDSTSSKCG